MLTADTIINQPATSTVESAEPLFNPGDHLHTNHGNGRIGAEYVRDLLVPIASLVTDHDAIIACAHDARRSETPGEPLDLCVRDDAPGRYEIADGHHRLVEALLSGATHVRADIYPIADDEPYQGPFYDFTGLLGATLSA